MGDFPLSVGIGDFNNDGNADLTTANIDNNVSVLLGNGHGGFAKQNTFAVEKDPLDINISDFNADGNADLVVANEGSNSVSVLLGDGQGGFAVQRIFATGKEPAVSIGDFNNDGNTDLVTANWADKTVSVLLNANETTQAAPQTVTATIIINEPLNLYGDAGGAKADVLIGTTGADKLRGLMLADKLLGDAGNDSLWGGLGNDSLSGEAGDDVLYGEQGDDLLKGGNGNDMLIGSAGNDTLTGGAGRDIFKFDAALKANSDQITDFNVVNDNIQLDHRIFTQLAKTGTLADSASAFHIGTKAVDAYDRIIYDKTTGALMYDDDGTGSHAAVQIATLGVKLALTAADFLIV